MKPGPRGLFEAIKRLTELTYMILKFRVNKPLWLFHEDLFCKNSMQKCIGDVKLLKWPVEVKSKC